MTARIPESREVWEHGNEVFDRRDALLSRLHLACVALAVLAAVALIVSLA